MISRRHLDKCIVGQNIHLKYMQPEIQFAWLSQRLIDTVPHRQQIWRQLCFIHLQLFLSLLQAYQIAQGARLNPFDAPCQFDAGPRLRVVTIAHPQSGMTIFCGYPEPELFSVGLIHCHAGTDQTRFTVEIRAKTFGNQGIGPENAGSKQEQ